MPHLRNDHLGHRRFGYGTFYTVCTNLLQRRNLDVKNFIPDKVRIPAFIVIIATFVTILQLCMQAYLPDLYETLGLFIPLIVVNCILLGRAEAFAAKHNLWTPFSTGSVLDSVLHLPLPY